MKLAALAWLTTRRHEPVPWSPRAWRQALYLAGGIPVQAAVPGLMVVSWVLAPIWVLPIWLLPLFFLMAGFFAAPKLTASHRRRLRAATGIEILARPPASQGLLAYARARSTWRQAGYNLVAGPLLAVAALAAIGTWVAGIGCALVYTYAWRLPATNGLYRGIGGAPGPLRVLHIPQDVYLIAAGIAGLLIAPWLTAAVAALDAWAAQALLGPSRAEKLEHQVRSLAQTRAGVVDAADAERRRLERDLHDGTQQRLVSLAMNLGMARTEAVTTEQARAAIAEAHEAAKSTLAELRGLIRGLHPAVLEDRGLDAALSGVAARMPIPVRLTVDMPRRPAPAIEAVAYFMVSEGLANIAKHAQASHAEVFVRHYGDRLHIIVSDDGVGGADVARGSGLAGLAQRAESVDGTFEISSPPGGPTLLTVDLPCARWR